MGRRWMPSSATWKSSGKRPGTFRWKSRRNIPDLAWLEMRGMRNIVAHEYFGVSLPIIWRAIEQDLTPLAGGLKRLLSSSA